MSKTNPIKAESASAKSAFAESVSIQSTSPKFNFSKKTRLLLILAILSATGLIISNLAATKLWDFFGISVDGGIVIFPLVYLIGDLIVELYGRKIANWVVGLGMLVMLIETIILIIVGLLPAYPNWENQAAWNAILGFAPRVMIASLLGYALSQLLSNLVFTKIRTKTGEKNFWSRLLGSATLARLVDISTFETVAFLGILSLPEFFAQAGFAYIAAVTLAAILVPVAYGVRKLARRYLGAI